jgi:hypothetical protein
VSRDRSLEEFAGGSADGGPDTGEDAETDTGERDGTIERESGPGVDPLVSTYRWTPTGEDCAACGARVEARWRMDGAFVCVDCKEW